MYGLDEGGFAVLEVSFGDGLRIVERLVESLVGTTHPHASLVDRVGDRVDIRVVADRERFEVVVARCLHLVKISSAVERPDWVKE